MCSELPGAADEAFAAWHEAIGQAPGRGGVSIGDPPRLGQPDREIQGSQQTLRWREMDSNPRSPAYDEFGASGRARDPRRYREALKPIVRVGERFAVRLERLSH